MSSLRKAGRGVAGPPQAAQTRRWGSSSSGRRGKGEVDTLDVYQALNLLERHAV